MIDNSVTIFQSMITLITLLCQISTSTSSTASTISTTSIYPYTSLSSPLSLQFLSSTIEKNIFPSTLLLLHNDCIDCIDSISTSTHTITDSLILHCNQDEHEYNNLNVVDLTTNTHSTKHTIQLLKLRAGGREKGERKRNKKKRKTKQHTQKIDHQRTIIYNLSNVSSSENISNYHEIDNKINHQTCNNDHQDKNNEIYTHNDNLPIIEAVLIPRKISISYIVRVISCILFTSSFLQCIRTSGIPFANAVIETLVTHNIKPQYHGDNPPSTKYTTSPSSSSSLAKISSFDIYLARKIASSSSSTGNSISLPPPFLPKLEPFVGLLSSLFLYLGITLLFPLWFVHFETWLHYIKVNVLHNYDCSRDGNDYISGRKMKSQNRRYNHLVFSNDVVDQIKSHLHYCDGDESSSHNHINSQNVKNDYKKSTGLAVLVHLSKYDQEIGDEYGKSHVILWLYSEQSIEDDCDKSNRNNSNNNLIGHNTKYYIELNQRRVYVDINIASANNHRCNGEKSYTISTKCRDGNPMFYQRESVKQLQSRLQTGIIHDSLSSASSLTKRKILTPRSLQLLQMYQQQYESYNKLSLPIPTIQKAFLTRITTPLCIMQFIGKLLSIVEDDSLAPSFFNILSTLGRHYWSARKSIVSATELATEIQGGIDDTSAEQYYWTLRPKIVSKKKMKKISKIKIKNNQTQSVIKNQWELIPSSKILPGDLFCLPPDNPHGTDDRNKYETRSGIVMPVDALLLEGSCVALEAVITGESVPQAKVALDCGESDRKLCLETTHRSSALFAGTTIMQCVYEQIESKGRSNIHNKLPKKYLKSIASIGQPVKCLALRTGSYSSKGEIVRALSKNKRHTGSITTPQSELDSIKLITVLSIFAILACASLFMPSLQLNGYNERKVNAFRRVIQCTRIGVASIPSDLPLALSYVAQSCSTKLRNEAAVVCSEPGALLTASQIDMVVFDKTGTLTSDTQRLNKVVYAPSKSKYDKNLHLMTQVVLAGCHALISMKRKLIGDPLDIASLEYSTWTFDSSTKNAVSGTNITDKLWQLKTFPFDSTRRRSSALLMVRHGDKYRLLIVLKGSPDSMISLLNFEEDTKKWYMDKVAKLGSQGLRVITMAAKDLSNDTLLVKKLFPKGLPTGSNTDDELLKFVTKARDTAQDCVGIDYIENASFRFFDFIGFSCFDTVIRSSAKRTVCDLKNSGIHVVMLTGDAPEAALAVANKCGFYESHCERQVLLDIDSHNKLQWILNSRTGNLILRHYNFSMQTTKKILVEVEKGHCSLNLTGKAFERVLDTAIGSSLGENQIACVHLIQNLNQISVISRSSPSTKQRVISALKKYCHMNVMMCGDGVNDIAAMKTADISAALLAGFGKEDIGAEGIDVENEIRKSKLMEKSLGGNRIHTTKQQLSRDQKLAIEKGGAAARVLVQDDLLRKSLELKIGPTPNSGQIVEDLQIKPGEASLAAPFTFLRPNVDGSESILRSGIATAAFSLSCHRSIALNSLMACFNLATLYRQGFRYGKYLWNVELSLMMALDQGHNEASSTPRPTVSKIRPHQSIFHPASALSILLQSICHLYILSYGHNAASVIERKYGQSFKEGIGIRLIKPESFGVLGEVFKSSSITKDGITTGIFGKKRFSPNHITNTVFIISCFQNTMIAVVNHQGLPFNGQILESKLFCFWIGASILFCVTVATESYPPLNKILELAPIPSTASKSMLLLLMAFDSLLSFIVDRLCIYLLYHKRWKAQIAPVIIKKKLDHAADYEEHLLFEERKLNKTMLHVFCCIGIWMIIQNVVLQRN